MINSPRAGLLKIVSTSLIHSYTMAQGKLHQVLVKGIGLIKLGLRVLKDNSLDNLSTMGHFSVTLTLLEDN